MKIERPERWAAICIGLSYIGPILGICMFIILCRIWGGPIRSYNNPRPTPTYIVEPNEIINEQIENRDTDTSIDLVAFFFTYIAPVFIVIISPLFFIIALCLVVYYRLESWGWLIPSIVLNIVFMYLFGIPILSSLLK